MCPVCTIYPIPPQYIRYILYMLDVQYIQDILSLDHILGVSFCHVSGAEILPPTVEQIVFPDETHNLVYV